MTDLLVLGTDTDAGKTAFCALWLAAFPDRWEYWKPIETGDSDTEKIARLVPKAQVHPPLKRFSQPVAPPLAARLNGEVIPDAMQIAAARPQTDCNRSLVIETFGSPFSPLNENELQVAFVKSLWIERAAGFSSGKQPTAPTTEVDPQARAYEMISVLVASTTLGTIGRTLPCLTSLANHGIHPLAVVLMGPPDPFALEQIVKHARLNVFSLTFPAAWDQTALQQAARAQDATLQRIRTLLNQPTLSTPQVIFDVQARDQYLIWHPYTSLRDPDLPLSCVGAQDEFLYLEGGRRLIDGISSWWTILHGHRHPVLMSALQEALARIDHVMFAGVTHPWAVELAELLLASACPGGACPGGACPGGACPGGRVFYSDNGSTAVEVALKMAYQFWCHRGESQRTRFIGFEGGYHGDTFGAMAISRDPVFFARFEPLLFQAEIVPLSAERLEAALKNRRGQVAAVIIEPLVQGAGGMRMHTLQELRDIAKVTRNNEVLLIVDEVMTGGGRTGTLWAHRAAGIDPDLICAGKTLAGGLLPLAATLVCPRVVDAFNSADPSKTFFHGHSFTAHPLACAVAVANWQLLNQLGHNAVQRRMESFWQSALAPLRDLPQVRAVRVCGTIAAVELNVPGGYLAQVGRSLRRACLERNVLLRPLGSVLYAMPPLCTSPQSLEEIAQAMLEAVRQVRVE